ncbi:UNVERIFIED_CONTAM: hypothetical protein Slati_0194900 [Sesamum latifolium]|uniref:Uncharacterized protein n=1 Tax=Sesamum latifolium TaxID=2727402 RepID=A0AAW2YBH1_9LAMI
MGTVNGVYTAFTLGKGGFLSRKSVRGFFEGASSFSSFLFFPTTFFLVRRVSNLETDFLARDLKKSPSKSPCEKALAFTSWVAEGTSNVTVLNLYRYSFKGSLSFCHMQKS